MNKILPAMTLLLILMCCTAVTEAVDMLLYERVEETMTNSTIFTNPFTDTELRLDVSAPGERPLGSLFTWYGFHDGDGSGGQDGDVWKFRLLFDHPGIWTVDAGFYIPDTDTLNGPTQLFTYHVLPDKVQGEQGHVYIDPYNLQRFRHADGTSWVPFAFHGSMLIDRNHTVAEQWIDEHIARGIDAITVRFHSEAWRLSGQPGYWHYLLYNGTRATSWGSANDLDYTRFDVATWQFNEHTIEYAQSKGVNLSIWFGISGINRQYWSYGPKDYPNNMTLGPNQKLFIKYFLARWAPYTNWWHWTVDSEYEETGNGSLDRIRAYAAELQTKNPWKTLITTHVLSNWSPGNSPEFDIATLQRRVSNSDSGTTNCRSYIYDNDHYTIPVYNSEGVWHLANVTRSRIATWTHLMASGFSHVAHFSTGSDHYRSSWGVTWDQVNPRHIEDATEIGKMADFFNKTPGIDISTGVRHDELVSLSGGNVALCLAQPGENYYIWLDRGGTPTVELSGISGTFSVIRYSCTDLDNPAVLPDIQGGAQHDLGATPLSGFGNDYLFVIKKTGETPTITVLSPNGNETWTANGSAQVTWSATGSIENMDIELSINGGSSYEHILKNSTPNDGSEQVEIPNEVTLSAVIRISDSINSAVYDMSDNTFEIADQADTIPPSMTISIPSANGQTFKNDIPVSGTASDNSGVISVEWQLDSTLGSWNSSFGASSWNFTIPAPSDGLHIVYVRATDGADPSNTAPPVSRTFYADNTGTKGGGCAGGSGRCYFWVLAAILLFLNRFLNKKTY